MNRVFDVLVLHQSDVTDRYNELRAGGMDEAQALEAVRVYRERYTDVGWKENRVYPGIAPLVMDDALTNFDDDRLDLALGCLTRLANDRQVILFTCQRREPDRLDGQDNVTVLRLNGF